MLSGKKLLLALVVLVGTGEAFLVKQSQGLALWTLKCGFVIGGKFVSGRIVVTCKWKVSFAARFLRLNYLSESTCISILSIMIEPTSLLFLLQSLHRFNEIERKIWSTHFSVVFASWSFFSFFKGGLYFWDLTWMVPLFKKKGKFWFYISNAAFLSDKLVREVSLLVYSSPMHPDASSYVISHLFFLQQTWVYFWYTPSSVIHSLPST